MPIWKLDPINPDDEHWTASRYVGPLFVRAADDDGARELACRIGEGKLSGSSFRASLAVRRVSAWVSSSTASYETLSGSTMTTTVSAGR